MFGEIAVKHMPIVAKRKPARNENGIISREEGNSMSPKAASTGNVITVFIVLRVAPQRSSPVITSSIVRGVAIMASKVFWKYMRTNEAKVHSKNAEFMIAIAIRAGAINLAYDMPSIWFMKTPTPNPREKRYNRGCKKLGRKFTIYVFMNTSLFRSQTFQVLPVSLGISKYDIFSIPQFSPCKFQKYIFKRGFPGSYLPESAVLQKSAGDFLRAICIYLYRFPRYFIFCTKPI